MIVILEKPECNPVLCLFNDTISVKRAEKLLLTCVMLKRILQMKCQLLSAVAVIA